MLSWLTGPRITDVIEDLQTEPAYDATFVEPPDTPAPRFAVKAIKHAFFGTPAPEDANAPKQPKLDIAAKTARLPPPVEKPAPASPAKHINGILMTPGTANKARKTVSFGSQVVDNEGRKGNIGKSGVPNDCPGKFPSPWTPGTELKLDVASDIKPRTRLTEALYDARSTTQPRSGQKPKARDDSDITIDLGAPRSESGRYWKEQYETYARKSEKEVKQLVARQQVAKNFAKKKDDEATALINQLSEERKRFRARERELEQQVKELQEHLRKATSEKNAANMTIALLKSKFEGQKDSIIVSPLDFQESKMSFQIFEDECQNTSMLETEKGKMSLPQTAKRKEGSPLVMNDSLQEPQVKGEDKENSPPKSRRPRRQTLPSARPNAEPTDESRTATAAIEISVPSLRPANRSQTQETFATTSTSLPAKSPLSVRKPDPSKENLPLRLPDTLLSSPLPQASPEAQGSNIWFNVDDSPLPQKIDSLAFPISSAPSYSKATRTAPTNRAPRHRTSQSVSHIQRAPPQDLDSLPSRLDALRAVPSPKAPKATSSLDEGSRVAKKAVVEQPKPSQPGNSQFDISKSALHHADASSFVKKDRNPLPVDRKELAKRRLLERKRMKEAR